MNIEAAKELLNKYKSITLEQLEEKFKEIEEHHYNVSGSDIMESITGFGDTENCILCKEAKKLRNKYDSYCSHCIYKLDADEDEYYFHCLGPTYKAIARAKNAEELYKSLQNRIKYLEETIKICEKRSNSNQN